MRPSRFWRRAARTSRHRSRQYTMGLPNVRPKDLGPPVRNRIAGTRRRVWRSKKRRARSRWASAGQYVGFSFGTGSNGPVSAGVMVVERCRNRGQTQVAGTDAVEVVQESERALVERAACGDHAAFEALYRTHAGWVYALCLRMCAAADVAEEATQLTFVKVWERLETYRGDSGFRPWLRRLAVNMVLSGVRQTNRRTARVFNVEDPDQYGGADPDRLDERIDLERAIATLPDGARTVLVLHDIEGLRHDEIAELAGIAAGTSKAQLHRARRLLRERLTQ